MPNNLIGVPNKTVRSISELLAYEDKEFVQMAYLSLLGRLPDRDGYLFYLDRIREGFTKLGVIRDLRLSREGRTRSLNIAGIEEVLRLEPLLRIPFAKKIIWRLLEGSQSSRRIRKIERHVARMDGDHSQRMEDVLRALGHLSNLAQEQTKRLSNLATVSPAEVTSGGAVCSEERAVEAEERELVEQSGLFDRALYLEKYADVAAADVDPLDHYMEAGYVEGRTPNILFDTRWYLEKYPDVTGNPLLHYVRTGAAEGRSTSRSFNGGWYADNHPDVRASGVNPLFHYLNYGYKEGRKISGITLDELRTSLSEEFAEFLTPHGTYESWINANELSNVGVAELRKALDARKARTPKISLITPVYNTPPELLQELIDSVLGQVYQNWELCLVDDASPSRHVKPLLAKLAKLDKRIRIAALKRNGGISVATNHAVDMASGEIIAFLDHDDLITKDCLAELAIYYADHPNADVVYSDDDKIDLEGKRFAPQFKPDWSPTLLLSYMYFGHVFTVRRSLFQELGGFRKEYDGSQDYDFALRAVEHARHVGHVPKILYHWRVVPGSTAASGDAKPASLEAGRKAVEQAVQRRGINSTGVKHPDWAQAGKVGMYAIDFPDNGPSVSIVIPTFNQVDLLKACIKSLEKTTYRNFNVLVIDNESNDPLAISYLQEIGKKRLHKVHRIGNDGGKFSFAKLMNKASHKVESDYILFLNNDTEVINPRWLSQMVGYAQMKGVGSVGARLYFDDRTIQHAGIVHGYHDGLAGHAFRGKPPHDWGYMGFIRTAREFSAVTAACVLTSKQLFDEMGGFDEADFAVAYNDVDYGFRLVEAGWRNIYCPDAELFHFEGKSRGFSDNPKEVGAYRRKYHGWYDKSYNANLSLREESFEPAPIRLANRPGGSIKVAVVSHNLNFEGAPYVLLDLVLGLVKSGAAEITVLSPCDGPLRASYEEAGVPVKFIQDPQAGVADADLFVDRCETISSTYKELGAEVVIANTLSTFWAVNAARKAGVAAIWCQHESEQWQSYFDYLADDLRGYAYSAFAQAYRVTYVAEATRRAWQDLETRHNFQLIRHGVPSERLDGELEKWPRALARKELGLADHEVAVILVGTICKRKNQEDLLQAFRVLPEGIRRQMRVFLVGAEGEPHYAESLKRFAAGLSAEDASRIHFVGPVNGAALYYAAADIAVCTSIIESAPRVTIEAMNFGLPIITTPVFGIPELVREHVNAEFYAPGDINRFSELLAKFVSDTALREKLGASSRDVLQSLPGYMEMIHDYTALIRQAYFLQGNQAFSLKAA